MANIRIYSAVQEELNTQHLQYTQLIDIVKNSGALENNFFDKCRAQGLSKEELVKYLFNWYPITESFAVHGLLYTHHVAKYLQKNINSPDFENIEAFFCKVLEISKGEFEMMNVDIEPNNFHPKAFTRLSPKLGVAVKDLISRSEQINPETIILEKNIIANFSNADDILCGFANFFVVETIAYNIVESMDNTFGRLTDGYGHSLYTSHEMLYITEHLELEIKHSDEVAKMLNKLDLSDKSFILLKTYVEELSSNFSKYWASIAPSKL